MPRVSVLLPIYNTNPRHLTEAIDSVLGQDFADFELLIVNDASTDEAPEKTVLTYKDTRITYVRNVKNAGIGGVRNQLIGMARGEYLAVMDHDDISLHERLARQVAFMDANPDVAICGTAHRRFGTPFKRDTVKYPPRHADIMAALFFKCVIHHPSAMIRAETLKRHGIRYDEVLVSSNDRKLYLDVAAYAKLHNLPEVLCLYRHHKGMTSRTKRQAIVADKERLNTALLDKIEVGLTTEQRHVFDRFTMNRRTPIKDSKTLADVEQVLSALVAANDRSGYFPREEFRISCAKYLVKRCTDAVRNGGVASKDLLARTPLPVARLRQPLLLRLRNFIA